MFNDNTTMALCALTLLLFFVGGITGFLSNPFYIGITVVVYLIVILNLVLIKKPETDDAFFEPKIKK